MGTIAFTRKTHGNNGVLITWPNLATGDEGQPFEFVDAPDRSVQVYGTPGAGGAIQMKGSNDQSTTTNWDFVHDNSQNDLSMVPGVNGIEAILEVCVQIKPVVDGGDGTTDLTVKLLVIEK